MQPADAIKALAREVGFDDCRIAAAAEAEHADSFREWIADGCHGDMAWMERTPERRCDPREVLQGCKAVVTLALNYYPGSNPAEGYRIARYAWNDDYHDIVEKMLRRMDEGMQALGGTQRFYVDTGPVLERDHASAAGLGWNGKSTVQIHKDLGTWFFLAELLTTLDLPADKPFGDHCGKCTRCINACPTNAIIAPHRVDARRCVSYLTIEHKGPIPEEFREAIGDRLYGCDECLEVCPWNKFAKLSRESRFHARENVFALKPRDFLALTDEEFRALFSKSPIKRIKRPRFLRNACVVLGNTGTSDDLPALQAAATDPDPLISEHALWAIAKIESRTLEGSARSSASPPQRGIGT